MAQYRTSGSRSRASKPSKAETEEAIKILRELLPPGTTVYTILRHRARSGMSRSISLVIPQLREPPQYFVRMDENDQGVYDTREPLDYNGKPQVLIRDITHLVARATGERIDEHGGITYGGCGMDMGFNAVYSLARTIYPDGGPCTGDAYANRCPSNDHTNSGPQRDKYDRSIVHRDSGYTIGHSWL